jgi:hypothetical protein
MTTPPRPAWPQPARPPERRQPARRSAGLTFWLDSPYQGFRRGYRCPSGDLTAPRSWSVHGRCATAGRRVFADHRRARTVKAGMRTLSGERAGGGLRTGLVPGGGEETPAHAPARPSLVNGRRRGGTTSTRPAGTALHPRAESADASLTARPARGCDPGTAARSAALPWRSPACPGVRPGGKAGFGVRGDRHGSRAERHFRHDFACQPAFHPATLSDGCPAVDPDPQTCRQACRPWPGRRRWSAAEYT